MYISSEHVRLIIRLEVILIYFLGGIENEDSTSGENYLSENILMILIFILNFQKSYRLRSLLFITQRQFSIKFGN